MPTKPKYDLLDDNGIVVASEMDLEYAVLFLKTLMLEYYAEKEIMYSIRRHVYEVEMDEVDVAKKNWDQYAKQAGLD